MATKSDITRQEIAFERHMAEVSTRCANTARGSDRLTEEVRFLADEAIEWAVMAAVNEAALTLAA
ncbi:MAG: hypothetical protein P4L82_16740 [Ancalomicrobiaceae bacterium]|nr:hypothetical protein [Ancalomicrobiaceae bacterium]